MVSPSSLAAPNERGGTALHVATTSELGDRMIDELLRGVEDKADGAAAVAKALGHPDEDGLVPLGIAAKHGNGKACRRIIAEGADRMIGNLHNKKNPVVIAVDAGHMSDMLKIACYDCKDFKQSGFSAKQAKDQTSSRVLCLRMAFVMKSQKNFEVVARHNFELSLFSNFFL